MKTKMVQYQVFNVNLRAGLEIGSRRVTASLHTNTTYYMCPRCCMLGNYHTYSLFEGR